MKNYFCTVTSVWEWKLVCVHESGVFSTLSTPHKLKQPRELGRPIGLSIVPSIIDVKNVDPRNKKR